VALSGEDDGNGGAVSSRTEQSAPAGSGPKGGDGAVKPAKPQPKPEPEIAEIVIEAGQPVGGVAELEFKAGETMAFKVSSDSAEEVHLHGYDISRQVAAGDSTTFEVPATIEGVFEAELEQAVIPIAEISIVP